jgi:AcrR family transcriptional regulator
MRTTRTAPVQALSTKSLIIDQALRIASREGIEGLTIGELAKAVGMSKSGLFAHFRGRDQLQLEVLKLATSRFVEQVMKPAFQKTKGVARIRALIDHWLVYLNNEHELPGGSVLISASTELDDRPGELRDYVQAAQRELISNIERSAKIAVTVGDFSPRLDVESFAWSLYSYVLGYHHFKRMLEDPKAEQHLRQSVELLLRSAANSEASIDSKLVKVKKVLKRIKK